MKRNVEISGATKLACVIGDPVSHSISPAIHNSAFEFMNLDWIYSAFCVSGSNLGEAVGGLRALGVRGVSVTMPHKSTVIRYLDVLSQEAQRIESVNTIRLTQDGRLEGFSTDGLGFLNSLHDEVALDLSQSKCAVIGAGGAARAVAGALLDAQVRKVIVINRNIDNAEKLRQLSPERIVISSLPEISECDLVVNATPIGMNQLDDSQLIFDPELIAPGQIYSDLIYWPTETKTMAMCRDKGVTVIGGLSMLVHQAALAFRLWTGLEAPIEVMKKAARDQIGTDQ